MGRKHCRTCLALFGLGLVSCRVHADAHEHSSDHAHEHEEHAIDADFVSWLGSESPGVHVQHIYNNSNTEGAIFPWLMDSVRVAACGPVAEDVSIADAHAHDPGDGHEDEHAGTDASGHMHRRLLDHDHDHDHAHEDDMAEESDAATRVLTAASLEERQVSSNAGSDESVTEALAYITACLIDPSCVLEQSAAAADVELDGHEDDHDDHDGHATGASKFVGLKIGLAAAFLAMTVTTSYLPLAFMWSRHYTGILTCLNVFSGSVFLSVGIMHLLPHVAEYEAAANLSTDFPVGNAVVIIGFLLVLFMEQVVFDVHGSEADARSANINAVAKYTLMTQATSVARRYHSPLLTEGAVVLHAVLECIVLGLSGSREDIWLLFSAICSHKVFTTMSQSARFLRLGCPPALLFILLAPFHLLPPLGVVLGALTGEEHVTVSLVLAALATGTFLYVGAFEVVAEEFAEAGHSPVAEEPIGRSCWSGACCGGSGNGCVDDAVAGDEGREANRELEKSWVPSRAVKFVIFMFGCGVLFAVTAALPSHSEVHNH